MTHRLKNLTLAGLTALALTLAACGGDDESSSLSKEELISKANAICDRYSADLQAIPEPADITDADQAAAYFEKVVPIARQARTDLKELKAPDEIAADWDDYNAKGDEGAKLLEELLRKSRAKDPSGLEDLQRLEPLAAQSQAAARKVGADKCAD